MSALASALGVNFGASYIKPLKEDRERLNLKRLQNNGTT